MSEAIIENQSTRRPAVTGGVRLGYIADSQGSTLKEQWVRPPLHLAKTYHDKDWAINLLTSPTAGLLEGDQLEINCKVGAEAKAALISPAACRVHTMADGEATIHQHYQVGKHAALDVWPAPLVLQSASRLRQFTRVDLEPTSTLLLTEIISPGRASYGESFEFKSWRSRLRIYQSGTLVTYENFLVSPKDKDVSDWRNRFPDGPYVSIYFLTPQPTSQLIEPLHKLSSENVAVGASSLREGGIGIKLLAKDGLALRQAVLQIRELLIHASAIDFPKTLERAQTFFY